MPGLLRKPATASRLPPAVRRLRRPTPPPAARASIGGRRTLIHNPVPGAKPATKMKALDNQLGRQACPGVARHRHASIDIARDCQILPDIMTGQILENEHRCRVYLKNVVCFQMTSNERCVHFWKFRNKTFKTNMDVVFI